MDRGDASRFVIREAEPERDDDAVVGLLAEYLAWGQQRLATEYGVEGPAFDPALIRQGLVHFRPPTGTLLLAECDGQLAGTGAIRMLGPAVAEVKRMYVAPRWRDRHLGSALFDRLFAAARQLGANTVRLDTIRFMVEAQRLYRSRGFVERPPYEGTEVPAHLQQHWLFFERSD